SAPALRSLVAARSAASRVTPLTIAAWVSTACLASTSPQPVSSRVVLMVAIFQRPYSATRTAWVTPKPRSRSPSASLAKSVTGERSDGGRPGGGSCRDATPSRAPGEAEQREPEREWACVAAPGIARARAALGLAAIAQAVVGEGSLAAAVALAFARAVGRAPARDADRPGITAAAHRAHAAGLA